MQISEQFIKGVLIYLGFASAYIVGTFIYTLIVYVLMSIRAGGFL